MKLTYEEYGLTWLTGWGKVFWSLVIVAVVAALIFIAVFLTHRSDVEYRNKCEDAGGRVVQVRGEHNICVEHETDKLLWI